MRELSFQGATDEATSILKAALLVSREGAQASLITSPRLLLAAIDLGSRVADGVAPDDLAGARALHSALAQYPRFADLRSSYQTRPATIPHEPDTVVISKGVEAILRTALHSSLARRLLNDAPILTADALSAAIVTQLDTDVSKRLSALDISNSALRLAILKIIESIAPDKLDEWRSALISAHEPARRADASARVAYPHTDDPRHLDDQLGVRREAYAFARVAIARQVKPPLAFGIFGDWGSGKSFFVNLIQRHVDGLAAGAKRQPETSLFHQNVVQIRFNAWHYVDTNLWASLVHHIFLELDQWIATEGKVDNEIPVFDKLATARDLTLSAAEQLVRRREDQKRAAEQLVRAQQELEVAKSRVGATSRVVWDTLRQQLERTINKDDRKRIDQFAEDLGITRAGAKAAHFKEALEQLKSEGARAKAASTVFWARLTSGRYLILAFLAVVLVPPTAILVREYLAAHVDDFPLLKALIAETNANLTGLAAVIAAATTMVRTAASSVRRGVETINRHRVELENAIQVQLAAPSGEVRKAEEALAKQSATVTEAHASLATTTDRLAEAETEFAQGSGRGRLLNFVRERVADGRYTKHLGLIAAVRRDFTELSVLMESPPAGILEASTREREAYDARISELIAKAGPTLQEGEICKLRRSAEPAAAQGRAFERVILYIDDLDRCPPRQVMDVLQAVHLLLTFPLFVVVVAVDAKWLKRSLTTHYTELMETKLVSAADRPSAVAPATPRDYLEKIFQVPYWLPPMSAEGSRALVMSFANRKAGDEIARADPDTTGKGQTEKAKQESTEEKATEQQAAEQRATGQRGAAANPTRDSTSAKPDAAMELDEQSPKVSAEALLLTGSELAFMSALAPFVGRTPRGALRFVNIYRVIKASLPRDDIHALEHEGGYRALMAQLAIIGEAPELQTDWSTFLDEVEDSEASNLPERLKKIPWLTRNTHRDAVLGAIEAFSGAKVNRATDGDGAAICEEPAAVTYVLSNALPQLRYYAKFAVRYSFGD